MSRKDDLEQHITEAARLIHEYERILQVSSDPKEQARARLAISEQHGLLQAHLASYTGQYEHCCNQTQSNNFCGFPLSKNAHVAVKAAQSSETGWMRNSLGLSMDKIGYSSQ